MDGAITSGGTGAVVLELGGDVGACIVRAPARLEGNEVEIRRTAREWDGRHALVRVRHLGSGDVHVAVFERLEQGCWEARLRHAGDGGPGCSFEIEGGRVTYALLTE
jgi:hypothetical protein